jgi:hypothetical protein
MDPNANFTSQWLWVRHVIKPQDIAGGAHAFVKSSAHLMIQPFQVKWRSAL